MISESLKINTALTTLSLDYDEIEVKWKQNNRNIKNIKYKMIKMIKMTKIE